MVSIEYFLCSFLIASIVVVKSITDKCLTRVKQEFNSFIVDLIKRRVDAGLDRAISPQPNMQRIRSVWAKVGLNISAKNTGLSDLRWVIPNF